jgi:endo-alpha-1,4-polygalactosaminidase (GH114 family)
MQIIQILLLFLLLPFLLSGCTSPGETPTEKPTEPIVETTPSMDWWRPTPGLSWQWQLTGKFDLDYKSDVIDIDVNVGQSVVDHFHNQGTRVICYISVGSYENWREDADQFPDEVLGNDYEGWSGEKWLDIRRIDLLAPIMLARLDECAAKGFDGVEPDNMQIHDNNTGFPLTYEDQLKYSLWLAKEAHVRGLAIGQKNAPDMVPDLVSIFDFAILEDAFFYEWATDMQPYIDAGKPVFAAEYTDLPGNFDEFCRQSNQLGFSTILKHRDLDQWLETCPDIP